MRSLTWYICCVGWVLAYVFLAILVVWERRALFSPWVMGVYWSWEVLHATSKYGTSTFSAFWLRAFSVLWAALDLVTVMVLIWEGGSENTINFLAGLVTMSLWAWLEGPPTRHAKYASIPVTALCMAQLCTYVMLLPPNAPLSWLFVPLAWWIAVGNITGAMATWHKMPWGVVGKAWWIIVSVLSVEFIVLVHLFRAGQPTTNGFLPQFLLLVQRRTNSWFPGPTTLPLLILGGTVLIGCALGIWRKRSKKTTLEDSLHEVGLPAVDGSAWRPNPYQFLLANSKEYGFQSYVFVKNGAPHLVVQHPDTIRKVLRDVGKVLDRYPAQEVKDLRGGGSLEFLTGETHRKHKRALNRSMGMNAPKENMVKIYQLCRRYVPLLEGDATHCKEVVRTWALEVATVVLFGGLLSTEEISVYSTLFSSHFEALVAVKSPSCPDAEAKKACGMRARIQLQDLVMTKVKQAREDESTGGQTRGLGSTLSHLVKEDLEDEEVVEHLFMVWAAGFEPVRVALTWILALMGSHEKVYECVRDEVHSLKGLFQEDSGVRIHETMLKMKYSEAVYREALRWKPPASYITFGLNPEVPGSYELHEPTMDKKIQVNEEWRIICAWSAVFHNDEEYEDPERFDPERFLGPSHGKLWCPFGIGLRQCPAMHLVRYETLLFIFTLFEQYDKPSIQATTEAILDKPNESPKDLVIRLGPRAPEAKPKPESRFGTKYLCYDLDHPKAAELLLREDTKIIHLLRHGEAMHQVKAREEKENGKECLCFAPPKDRREDTCPFRGPQALVDPVLSEAGKAKVAGLEQGLEKPVQKVFVSPTQRAIETGMLAFSPTEKSIPVVALEQLRARMGAHMHSKRLPISSLRARFPDVDFSQIQDDEDVLWREEDESRSSLDKRAETLLQTIFDCEERCVGVVTHVTLLLALFFPASEELVLGKNTERPQDDGPLLDYAGVGEEREEDHRSHILGEGRMRSSIWVPERADEKSRSEEACLLLCGKDELKGTN